MEVSNVLVIDDVLGYADAYVHVILNKPFQDIPDGENFFKGIQLSSNSFVSDILLSLYPDHKVTYDFIRQSPKDQEEPNFIHSDREMCDTIAILYLNKEYPEGAGTTIYENKSAKSIVDKGEKYDDEEFSESVRISMKYNRMIAFPADVYHSRNIKENFGTGDKSRLVQVIFLKRKD